VTNPPEPPPYPGDDAGLPSYGSVPPPPPPSGDVPPPPPPPAAGGAGWPPAGPAGPVQNQKALAALILGLISIPLMFCCIGLGTGIVSLILGILGRKEIQSSGGTQTGDGMALAGIIIGIIAIVVTIVMTVLVLALGFAEFESDFAT
jgi:hypothetical protein